MKQIALTEDQANVLKQAKEIVEIRDPGGNWVGIIDPKEAQVLAAWRQRRGASQGPGIPGHNVQAHLQALQGEWDRTGGFDAAYMQAFLTRLRAKDPFYYHPVPTQ